MRDKGTAKTRKTNRVFRFFAFSYKNFARSDSFPSHPSNELRTEVLHPDGEAAQKAGKTTACKTGRTLFVRFRSVCIHRSDGGLAMGNEDKRKFCRLAYKTVERKPVPGFVHHVEFVARTPRRRRIGLDDERMPGVVATSQRPHPLLTRRTSALNSGNYIRKSKRFRASGKDLLTNFMRIGKRLERQGES